MAQEVQSRRARPETYLFLFALFAGIILLTHGTFLDRPFFWDEVGHFVPAALDLYRDGYWIPRSVTPNVHPPGVALYLTAWWRLAGFSALSTRIAMLFLAAAGVLVVFLLAIRLCRGVPGAPALLAVALLLSSPLFYTQAMMAQLDMPAMVFTCLGLLLFLEDRFPAAAGVCVILALVKETGVIVALVLCTWLIAHRRFRPAAYFLLPALALAVWLILLQRSTGYLFGNPEFTRYNLYYPLHPVRLAVALVRRFYFLFIEDLRWIGTIGIVVAWRNAISIREPAWRLAALLVAAHIAFFSVLGGATLERYLLPVFPLVLIAIVAAISRLSTLLRTSALGAIMAASLLANFWNPPYPFPFENNLACTDFVRVQQAAARFVARTFPAERITTAWPLSAALRMPELGYVQHRMRVAALPDFYPETVAAMNWDQVEVLILYSR